MNTTSYAIHGLYIPPLTIHTLLHTLPLPSCHIIHIHTLSLYTYPPAYMYISFTIYNIHIHTLHTITHILIHLLLLLLYYTIGTKALPSDKEHYFMKTSLVDNMDLNKLNKQDIELLRKLEYNLINDNKPIEVEFQGVMTLIFDDDEHDDQADNNENNSNNNNNSSNSSGLVGASLSTHNLTTNNNIVLSSTSSTTSHDTSNGYCSMDAEDNTNNNSIIGIALQQYNNQATSHNLLSSPIITNKSIHNSSQKRKLKSVTSEKTGFGNQLTGTGQSFPSVENQAQQQQRQRKINEISFSYILKSFREAIIIPDGHGY